MTSLRSRILPLVAAGVLALAAPPQAAETAAQGAALARALDEARAGNWTAAGALAGETRSQVAADIVEWLRLRETPAPFADYERFLARNAGWPGLATLRARAEAAMPADLGTPRVIAFFAAEPPRTGAGALRYAEALVAAGRREDATAAIIRAWRTLPMSAAEQEAILVRFGSVVAPHHTERLDHLLWEGQTDDARRMLGLVDPGWRALGEARIGLRRDVDGTTALINAVPEALRSDPGLAYERYLWRVRKGRWEDAEAFLIQTSTSAEALGRPDLWMDRRPNLARAALRRGDATTAYRIAAQNYGRDGAKYADSEWLAGYIALTRMDDPGRALAHFQRFEGAVRTPISLGRAGYWAGLAHERAGDPAAARDAFATAARHQTSFYGQLAAERAGIGPDPSLAGSRSAPDWRGQAFTRNSVVQAGHLLALAGDDARAMLFLRHAAEGLPPAERAALAQMAIDIGRPHIGVRIAKDAASAGVILPNQSYPLTDLAGGNWPVPTELALSIARQESEFNPAAVSTAGARGLMQLMPGTAEQVARKLGVAYSERALTADPLYNARLGTTYLDQMLARYGGSYVLTAAAYNAGPGRVDQWIAEFGDPRTRQIDVIDWIESIPFEETRNYVMRVLEGLHVYRARLEGRVEPIRLVSDINRAG
jgi:soluble lytic murein transglycosylase